MASQAAGRAASRARPASAPPRGRERAPPPGRPRGRRSRREKDRRSPVGAVSPRASNPPSRENLTRKILSRKLCFGDRPPRHDRRAVAPGASRPGRHAAGAARTAVPRRPPRGAGAGRRPRRLGPPARLVRPAGGAPPERRAQPDRADARDAPLVGRDHQAPRPPRRGRSRRAPPGSGRPPRLVGVHIANEERLLQALSARERRALDDALRRLLAALEP